MFEGFFYRLRDYGIPVSPTSFLRLQKALAMGMISGLDDFYVVARSIMIKSERQFDTYDKIFANYFAGKELDDELLNALTADMQRLLREWLNDPANLAGLSPEEQAKIKAMTPEELERYFLDRLREQTERHDGGNRWIGTRGTSPVGHGGHHPGGMRVGGTSMNRSAIQVAMERRYIDYSAEAKLSAHNLGEALRSLKHLAPAGPKDKLNVEKSIYETVRNAGEIELVFDRSLRDKLSVFLFIDNGGWSMTPYVRLTRALFGHAESAFKRLRTFFFHNCIYEVVYEDPRRYTKPVRLIDLLKEKEDTRVIIVGDAAMAPYELLHPRGALAITHRMGQRRTGIDMLGDLRERFPHSVWVNPIDRREWDYTYGAYSISLVREVFPMVDLTLGGIEKAALILKGK
ncbi:MAG TPA: hypothetical protein PKW95_16295 [bacterium]|nr:hypothetical protein [bacterium]